MSDLVNALNTQVRSGGVLGAIANPNVVNPVGAMGAAAAAANSIYQVRAYQAEQAIGGILQQSTDENGNVDYNKAQSLAANAGPVVQMRMQDMLLNASRLRTEQTAQGNNFYTTIARAGATIMNDASDANVNATFDSLIAAHPGMRAQYESERQRVLSMQPAQRAQYAYQHLNAALDANDSMHRSPYGQTTSADIGGTQQPVTTYQGSPYGPGGQYVGPGVTRGAQPGQFVPGTAWDPSANGGRGAWVSVQQPATTVQPGGQPVPGQPGPAPGQRQPPAPASTAPPPPPKGTTVQPLPGRYPQPPDDTFTPTMPSPTTGPRSDIPGGGTQVAAGDTFAPSNVGPAAAPSPAVSGDVAAIQAGRARAQATPTAGTQTAQNVPPGGMIGSPILQTPQGPVIRSGPPMGTSEVLQNDIKAHTDAALAAADQRQNLQAGESALEALKLAGNYTGPGTGTAASLYAWLQARAPQWAIPQGQMSDTAWREVLAKNLLRFAQASGMRMNTDLGLSEALQGTANADSILPNANREILIQDLGRARQRVAQTQLMPAPSPNGDVVNHFKTYTTDTDSRAFAWDLYSPAERKAIEAEVAKDPKAQARLDRGLVDADKVGLIKTPAPAPRQRQGAVQPAPQSNPLLAAAVSPYSSPAANALAA